MAEQRHQYVIRLHVEGGVYAADIVEALRELARRCGARVVQFEVSEVAGGELKVVLSNSG